MLKSRTAGERSYASSRERSISIVSTDLDDEIRIQGSSRQPAQAGKRHQEEPRCHRQRKQPAVPMPAHLAECKSPMRAEGADGSIGIDPFDDAPDLTECR